MKRLTQIALLVAFAVASCNGASSHAAVISVQPAIGGYFNPTDFSPVPAPAPVPWGGTVSPGAPLIVQVDVYMEVLSLAPGEGSFDTAVFDFTLDLYNGVSAIIPTLGWFHEHVLVDTNGAAPGGLLPVFDINDDLGPDPFDLKGIVVSRPRESLSVLDPRRDLGEAGSSLGVPYLLGSAYLEWNGLGKVSVTLDHVEVFARSIGSEQMILGTSAPVVTIAFGNILPEPSSLLLLGSCLVGLSFRRRVS